MNFLIILIAISGLSCGLFKQINHGHHKTFTKQSNMDKTNEYIVQYIGFKTNLNETAFIKRWTPFALNFKSANIKTIDLYSVLNNETEVTQA